METETQPSALWSSLPRIHKRDRSLAYATEQQSTKRASFSSAKYDLSQALIESSQPNGKHASGARDSDRPRVVPNDDFSFSGGPEHFTTLGLDFIWTENDERTILAPYNHVASVSGKEFRTLLLDAFNIWFKVDQESMAIIRDVVRMLHTSSLLIDDVQDMSELRRGQPVAHKIYGIAQTINTGNYVYFLAAAELQKMSNAAAGLDIFMAEMLNLHRGQGLELYWRDTLVCPTEHEYLMMVSNKTGGLFRMAMRLMQAESSLDPATVVARDYDTLVQLLGLIYQISDDYKNLKAVEYVISKGYCEDLTEGKFSFPIIHSIQSNPTDRGLLQILGQKTKDVQIKKYAVSYMEKTGSLDYTRRVVGVLIQRAREEVYRIDKDRDSNQAILQLLDKMALD
ncbi:hypothetical protein FOCG_17856 [Fusarium oxysporum f. sp. radicis-lycopersici 26381]|nr:hypothetical protein FOCG_18064 [Fusarium oxysporum f. sp. radicis-lycopersici 26381]EXL39544.1 hypothetical protein FOCG_17856 [Fusarium oxysporum f. sp. radicis-lycopersici 26381]